VQRAIASAQAQTYPNIEIIVADNASRDGTEEVLGALARRDGRVRYFRYEENVGPVGNWWRGVDLARGEYVKLLFSDDWLEERALERYVAPFLEVGGEDVAFVYSDCYTWSKRAKENPGYGRAVAVRTREEYLEAAARLEVPCSPSCALFRRRDLLRAFTFSIPTGNEDYYYWRGIGYDWVLFLNVVMRYPKVRHVAEPLVNFSEMCDEEPCISTSAVNRELKAGYRKAWYYFVAAAPLGKREKRFLNTMHVLRVPSFAPGCFRRSYRELRREAPPGYDTGLVWWNERVWRRVWEQVKVSVGKRQGRGR
jgi:glycosyltransferase involved in cell wall biosynthesis